jgi:hypothetical protein
VVRGVRQSKRAAGRLVQRRIAIAVAVLATALLLPMTAASRAYRLHLDSAVSENAGACASIGI